jgi:glycosyltransferase involved in cell wall biosynthesis
MRIGFDASALGARTTGASEYQRQLLAALPGVAPTLELTVYTARGGVGSAPAGMTAREMPWDAGARMRRILYGGLAWRRQWKRDRLDLLHVPVYYLPPGAPAKSIVTIYDARFLRMPETYPRLRYAFLRSAVPWSLRRASQVVTISEFTKGELVTLLGIDPDHITVTLLAARDEFVPVSDPANLVSVRRKYRLPEHFLLSASALEPRKNLARTVDAFALARRRGLTHELVLAGAKYFGTNDIGSAIARHGLERVVHLPGYVEDLDMPALYSAADAFIYPSLYEGFGIPLLESMACGTPVIASDAASIPEVVGTAARLVDPRDVESMAEGIVEVLTDTCRAAALCAAGFERVKLFSWERTARETAALYRRVIAGDRR